MSTIGDAFSELFGGGRSEGFQETLAELQGRAGSVTAAARAAGVDRRTWQRWQSGAIAKPKAATTEKVAKALRAARTDKGFSDATVMVSTKGADGRDRTLTGARLRLTPGTMAKVRQTYIETGSGEAAAKAFVNGIGDRFYQSYLTPDDEGIEWEGSESMDSDYLPIAVAVN